MAHLRFKRHYKLLLLLVLLVAVLIAGAGNQPIVSYSLDEVEQVVGTVLSLFQWGHT